MCAIYSRSRALSARVMHRSPNDTSCHRTHPVPPRTKLPLDTLEPRRALSLCRKPVIEFLMIANPKPDPFLARTQCNSTVIAGNSHRPSPTIAVQPLQTQTRIVPDFLRIFRTPFGRRRVRPAVERDKAPRTATLRGKSLPEIGWLHPWKRVWIATQLLLCLIKEPAQLWARSFVPDELLPIRVAGELRKQCRNMLQQLVPFGRRQCADRLLDFTCRAHQRLR
jgi:hypothetical protein